MGLLDGKKALIFGLANDHSIAWGIAKALHDQGAIVGFSSQEGLIERRVKPLAESISSPFVEPCDVQSDEDLKRVFARWQREQGELDILVHAVAFANREDLSGRFVDTSRAGFHLALDISAYSLCAMVREAMPVLHRGSTVFSLTYYGSEKVAPGYNVMGVAKATLEAITRYLANDLGPDGIRVNAISAGAVRTLSAAGVQGFKQMYSTFREINPLRENTTIENVGNVGVFLASELSSHVTGEVIFVDGGYNILVAPSPAAAAPAKGDEKAEASAQG